MSERLDKKCGDCPHCNQDSYTAECRHAGPMMTGAVHPHEPPPEWCPLPRARCKLPRKGQRH